MSVLSQRLRSTNTSSFKGESPTHFPKVRTPNRDHLSFVKDFEQFVNSKAKIIERAKKHLPFRSTSSQVSPEPTRYPVTARSSLRLSESPQKSTPATMKGHNNSVEEEVEASPVTVSEAVKKNKSITAMIKRTKKKIKFLGEGETERFDNRLQIFRGVNTFIDVKDLMKDMNIMNQVKKDNADLQQKVQNQIAALAKEIQLRKSMDEGRNDPLSHRVSTALDNARIRIITSRANSKAAFRAGHKTVGFRLPNTDLKLDERDKQEYNPDDKNDIDGFYDRLGDDLASGKLDKEELHAEIDEEEINSGLNYLKQLLEEKTRLSLAQDKRYHANFKKRAENVITVVKRAAKKIYDRDLTKEELMEKLAEQAEKTKEARRREKELQDEQIRQQQQSEFFFQTQYRPNQDLFSTDLNIDKLPPDQQIRAIQRKISNIEAFHGRSESLDTLIERRGRSSTTLAAAPILMNKKINSLHRRYANVLINDLDQQERDFQDIKLRMHLEINHLEDFYEQDVGKMKEDPMEALRLTFSNQTHFGSFLNKPIKLKNSRKRLAVVMGT